jgi:hypothetical protein
VPLSLGQQAQGQAVIIEEIILASYVLISNFVKTAIRVTINL